MKPKKKESSATRRAGDRYLASVPKKLPVGRVVVHNHIRHEADTPPGVNGFRAWTTAAVTVTRRYEIVRCRCGWAPHLGTHYRVKFSTAR